MSLEISRTSTHLGGFFFCKQPHRAQTVPKRDVWNADKWRRLVHWSIYHSQKKKRKKEERKEAKEKRERDVKRQTGRQRRR